MLGRKAEISPKLKNRVLALKKLHEVGAMTVLKLVAVQKWLTPEQLAVWDKGFDKARSYLGL